MARGLTRVVAGTGAFALAVLTPVATATAQSSGSTVITNTESVNASLDPSGNVDVVRVYDQIAIQGSGDVSYTNPVSTAGLRNLDGFGGFTVEDDAIVEETSVDGQLRRRTVSDFELDLPVSISVVYTLDGQEISPADLVGKSGEVNASYTITNETCAEEEVTVEVVDDTEDMTAEICDPMAGSLSFTLPSQYTDVVSETGFLTAGDGRGGTTMTLSVQMISGLTDSVVEADYTAQVENATIPAANLSILPVVVDYVAGAQKEALAGGADSGRELAENGELLDENVLALAEGSAELVNGLILLDEGAAQLSDALVSGAPGAVELADGAGQLSTGLNELQSQVPALTSGVSQLDAGAQTLSAGVAALDAGLAKLYAGVENLPQEVKASLAGNAEYQKLLGGLDQIIEGLRAPGTTDCEKKLADDPADPSTNCGAMDGVELISGLLATGANDLETKLKPLVQGLYFGAWGTAPCPSPAPPPADPPIVLPPSSSPPTSYCDAVSSVYYALFAPKSPPTSPLGGLQEQAEAAAEGLKEVYTEVDAALIPGLEQVKAGIPALVDAILANIESTLLASIGTPTPGCNPTATLRCASAALTAGAAELAAGTRELNASVGPLASGVNQLADGGSQVAAGSAQLADGVQSAADGSVQLSSGLGDAAEAGPQIPQGAQRLSAEGTSQLVEAGEETAMSFGTQVAILEAAAERTADGGLPFGAPDGALKAAAYSYDLAAATGATAQNTGRLLAGVVIAGAAAVGASFLLRRKPA